MDSKIKYRIVVEKPILFCNDELFRRLNWLGFKTLGHQDSLSQILISNGFSTPHMVKEYEQTYFKWQITSLKGVTHTGMYLNEADSLAEAIILLNKLELI
jgi:hypothetical protein